MEIIRKIIKSYVVAVVLYFILTFVLAALIMFTGFDEDWAYVGLNILASLVTLLLGYLVGAAVGKKGIFVGILSAIVFMLVIIVIVKLSLGSGSTGTGYDLILALPILSGAVGGVFGTNRNK